MKRIDELINETCPDELERLSPERVDREAVLGRTLEKLGLGERAESSLPELDPEKLVHPEPAPKRRWGWALGALAACLAVCLALGALFPAWTGNLFRWGPFSQGDLGGGARQMTEYFTPVTDEVLIQKEGTEFSISVKSAYCDGVFLACQVELHTQEDPNSPDFSWSCSAGVWREDSGEPGGSYVCWYALSLPETDDWELVSPGVYQSCRVFCAVSAEPLEQGPVRAMFLANRYGSLSDDVNQEMGEVTSEFSTPYAGELRQTVSGPVQDGPAEFVSLSASPVGSLLALDVPATEIGPESDNPGFLSVELEGGSVWSSHNTWIGAGEEGSQMTRWFHAWTSIPQESKRLKVLLLRAAEETAEDSAIPLETVAEFLVDLETGEVLAASSFPEPSATPEPSLPPEENTPIQMESEAGENGVRVTSLSYDREKEEMNVTVDVGDQCRELYSKEAGFFLFLQLLQPDGSQMHYDGSDRGAGVLEYSFSGWRPAAWKGDSRVLTLRAMALTDRGEGETVLGRLLAEFTVDLDRHTCVPSQEYRYLDGMPWDGELLAQETWAFPFYRAEDDDLARLEDGYQVEYMTTCPTYGEGGVFLNLATTRKQRKLTVELWDSEGQWVASGTTGEGSEMVTASDYGPLSQFSLKDWEFTSYGSLYGEETYVTGEDGPRELDVSGLFYQTVQIRGTGLTPARSLNLSQGPWTVKIIDQETGETFTQEIPSLSDLPDLPGGKENWAQMYTDFYPFVYVPEEKRLFHGEAGE